ncbi:hypothetical protein M1D55_19260 [Cupriavidus sp. JZ107]
MTNPSTLTREVMESNVEALDEVVGSQARYASAIFVAIGELAGNPKMAETVVGLAKVGRWLTENVEADIDCITTDLLERLRKGGVQ